MRSVASERGSNDTGRSKGMLVVLAFLPTCLAPRDELAQVAQIIANRNLAHIFFMLQVRPILVQCLCASMRDSWLTCSFHRLLSKALADMQKRNYLED